MNVLAEIVVGMRGVWAILRFDPAAPKRFDNTPQGVARSFLAAAAGLPIYLLVLKGSFVAMVPRPEILRFLPMMLLYYVIEWLIWPNLMVGVVRLLKRDQFYCRYIVAYNWLALAQMLLMLPYQIAVLMPGASLQAVAFIGLFASLAFALYGWFIARHALEIPGRAAFGLVMLNLLAGLVLLQFKALQLGL
ncbi:MAG: hypothetical protein JXQ84_00285 [Rhodospirillaceae bacterium]|nr:hypothetical protein [Rhodospirillaceae bacterium]